MRILDGPSFGGGAIRFWLIRQRGAGLLDMIKVAERWYRHASQSSLRQCQNPVAWIKVYRIAVSLVAMGRYEAAYLRHAGSARGTFTIGCNGLTMFCLKVCPFIILKYGLIIATTKSGVL